MCVPCMKKRGVSTCSLRRSQLRKYKITLSTLQTTTQINDLKEMLGREITTLNNMLANQDFCPTRQYITQYKSTINAEISKFT